MTGTADPLLTVETVSEAGTVVVVLRGELDPHTTPGLDEQVQRSVDGGATTLVIDLSALTFIDSTGLRSVIAAHKSLESRGGQLVLRAPGPTTQRLLDVTGLSDLLVIEP